MIKIRRIRTDTVPRPEHNPIFAVVRENGVLHLSCWRWRVLCEYKYIDDIKLIEFERVDT